MKKIILSIIILSALVLWQCNENNTIESPTGNNIRGSGSIRIYLVDSPAELDSVVIYVSRVEVHSAGTDTSKGSWTVINDSPRYFDLLSLRNGASAVLGDTTLPAGQYTQIRLILEDSNYVKDKAVKHSLTVPSGLQTGIKLIHSFQIESGKLYELYLDFNLDKSILVTGNGQYKLKPTINVVPKVISGSISGQVLPDSVTSTIFATLNDDTVSTTFTNNTGFFKLMALLEGKYNVHIIPIDPNDTLAYRDTTITNINVIANQDTDIGTITLGEK